MLSCPTLVSAWCLPALLSSLAVLSALGSLALPRAGRREARQSVLHPSVLTPEPQAEEGTPRPCNRVKVWPQQSPHSCWLMEGIQRATASRQHPAAPYRHPLTFSPLSPLRPQAPFMPRSPCKDGKSEPCQGRASPGQESTDSQRSQPTLSPRMPRGPMSPFSPRAPGIPSRPG